MVATSFATRLPVSRRCTSSVPNRLRRLRGQLGQQLLHLGLPEPAVPARRADRADPTGGGPAGDRLRVDPEQVRDLTRCQQAFPLVSLRHGHGILPDGDQTYRTHRGTPPIGYSNAWVMVKR